MSTLNLEQTADLLCVHANTVLDLASKGEIPAAKIGRAWVFVEEDVVSWLRKQTQTQTEARRRQVSNATGNGVRPVRRRHRRDLPDLPEMNFA